MGRFEVARKVLDKHGFEDLNKLQREALPAILSDRNVLVVAPTASGKTLLGEIAMIKAAMEGYKAVYLSPLRALATEKFNYFKVRNDEFPVGISTGDYHTSGTELRKYSIIISTYERFDSILRHKPSRLEDIGVVVLDEIHLIDDYNRGPVVEMIVARTPGRIIGLSATIGNPEELAEWLNAELVDSNWRPVELREGCFYRGVITRADGSIEYTEGKDDVAVVKRTLDDGGQVLIFRDTRLKAEKTAKKMADVAIEYLSENELKELERRHLQLRKLETKVENETLAEIVRKGAAFHHAGLSKEAREIVETLFRNRLIKILVATPTLAAGVNLPARTVIPFVKRYDYIYGYYRRIRVIEYKQMTGRAGRPGLDPYGEVIVIANRASDVDEIFNKYIYGSPEKIDSKLTMERPLRIYTLVAIAEGNSNKQMLENLFSKTFAAYQTGYTVINYVMDVVDSLKRWNFVKEYRGKYYVTKVGRLVVVYYLDPETAHKALDALIGKQEKGYFAYLHLLFYLPDIRVVSLRRTYNENISYMEDDTFIKLADVGIGEYEAGLRFASMLYDRIEEKPVNEIYSTYKVYPGDLYQLVRAAERITSSLAEILDAVGEIGHAQRLRKLSVRIKYGVREDALELVRLEGIGRARARILISYGIRSLEDIVNAGPAKLMGIPGIGEKLARSIYEQASRLLKHRQ